MHSSQLDLTSAIPSLAVYHVAARIVTKFDHMIPVLRNSCLLPTCQRITIKILLITCLQIKEQHGPAISKRLNSSVPDRKNSTITNQDLLAIPLTTYAAVSQRVFGKLQV